MRHFWPKGLAALGLALVASSPAWAGLPDTCQVCAGAPHAPHHVLKKKEKEKVVKVGHLCAACAARMQQQGGPPAAVMAGELPQSVACTTCGVPGAKPTMVMNDPNMPPPGMAIVGPEGSASLASNGSAPGFAVVGGTVPSAEPTPIGVVQAGFRAQGATPSAMPGMAGSNRPIPAAPTIMAPPPSRRPHVLSHLIFGSGKSMGENWYESRLLRRKSNHAAIAYGDQTAKVTELPASVVYGQR